MAQGGQLVTVKQDSGSGKFYVEGNEVTIGGSGAWAVTSVPFSTTIPLSALSTMPLTPVTNGMTFTIGAGAVEGGSCILLLAGNGTAIDIPTFSGMNEIIGSRIFDTGSGKINRVEITYNAGYVWYSITQGVTAIAAPDVAAPSVPTGLTAGAITSSSITFTWSASTDNTAVTGYKVLRDGSQIGTTASLTYTDTGRTGSTAYTYTVQAYDAAGNTSASSAGLSLTTAASGTPTTATPITIAAASGLSASGGEVFTGANAAAWNQARVTGTLASSGDGWIEAQFSVGNSILVALDPTTSISADLSGYDYVFGASAAGLLRYSKNTAAWTNTAITITPSATTRIRIKRLSGAVVGEYTTDDGATWTPAISLIASGSTVAEYGFVAVFGQVTINQPRVNGWA